MTTLFIDGFDHYGLGAAGAAAMLTGAYSQIPTQASPRGPGVPDWGVRTGAASLATGGTRTSLGDQYITALPATKTNVLVSCGFSLSNLPATNANQGICSFRDGSGAVLADLWVSTTGAIQLRGPGAFVLGTVLATSADGVVTPSTWVFLEMEIDTSADTFVLRVNDATGTGTPAISGSSLVFGRDPSFGVVATSPMASVALLQRSNYAAVSVTSAWLDDLVIRDNAGTVNNAFAGFTAVSTTYPTPPAALPAPVAAAETFTPTGLPVDMTVALSVALVAVGLKAVAGTATLQSAIVDTRGVVSSGSAHSLTTVAAYYTDVFNLAPSGAAMTPAVLGAGRVRLTPVLTGSTVTLNTLAELVVYQTGVANQTRQPAWRFVIDGHTFYVLDLGPEGTWAYDRATGEWCHLYTQGFNGQWNFANGTMWGDRIIAGDLLHNIAWELDPNQANDEGWRAIKHVVTGGVAMRSLAYIGCVGVQLAGSVGFTQSTVPTTLTLNFSDDNGASWSPDFTTDITPGDASLAISYSGLGSFTSPGRIFRVTDQGGMIRIDGMDADFTNLP